MNILHWSVILKVIKIMEVFMLENKKLFLFDIDGTLCLGDSWIGGALEFLNCLISKGKEFVFITNNSTKSCDDYLNKFKNLNLNLDSDNIMTASIATGYYMAKNYKDKNIFVLGTESFKNEMINFGLKLTEDEQKANCVLVAYDSELTYEKLVKACKILNRKNTLYIATNPDFVCPVEDGYIPDCGSICQMIENAVKRKPIYIGKPNPYMIDIILEKRNVEKSKCVVVGDRMYTDILCGINAGIETIAVLTGETSIENMKEYEYKPDYVFKCVSDILEELYKSKIS